MKKSSPARFFLRFIGPGFITGAADDDPSGIATCSQAGAQFGYGQLWLMFFTYPLMTAVQEACARIGAVTGKGIARIIGEKYNKKILVAVVSLVVAANTVNIGADIAAMAAAAHLIFPFQPALFAFFFTALILILELFTSYRTYARVLKWLVLALLAYPVTMLVVETPWMDVLRATFLPHMDWNFGFLYLITGILGTTISPYMFIWEASEEVEEAIERKRMDGNGKTCMTGRVLSNIRIDNATGMLSSQIVSWCIIVVTGTVLYKNGITDIRSAEDAARALEPLVRTFPDAGLIAKSIFSIGIVGLGLLAIPVLAGSASYALSETFGLKEGLHLKPREAPSFYFIMGAATVLGFLSNFAGVNPIQFLIFSAVFNGIAAVPLLYLILKISISREIMGEFTGGRVSVFLILIAFAFMAAAGIAMIAAAFR